MSLRCTSLRTSRIFSCWKPCDVITSRSTKKIGGACRARQILGIGGLLSAATLPVISVQIVNSFLAIFAMGMASVANDLTVPSSWGAAMDIGGRYAGSVSGGMNMGGAGGGAVAGAKNRAGGSAYSVAPLTCVFLETRQLQSPFSHS